MNHEELREMCALDGDWGGTEWGFPPTQTPTPAAQPDGEASA